MSTKRVVAAALLVLAALILQACGGGGGSSHGGDNAVEIPPPSGVAPSDLLTMSNWSLTLPRDPEGGTSQSAEVVSAQRLVDGYSSEWFQGTVGDGVTFFAPVNGALTANSKYPSSLLRELLNPGDASVNWTWDDFARMDATLAVQQVPRDNGKVVVAQIRGYNGENVAISELCKLVYEYNGSGRSTLYLLVLDSPIASESEARRFNMGEDIRLGETFSFTLRVQDRTIHIEQGSESRSVTIDSNWDGVGLYYRAGAGLQTVGQSETDGARVTFYELAVTHTL